MKAKGKFRGHSRMMAVFPTNFEYDPQRFMRRKPVKMQVIPLRQLIAMRALLKA